MIQAISNRRKADYTVNIGAAENGFILNISSFPKHQINNTHSVHALPEISKEDFSFSKTFVAKDFEEVIKILQENKPADQILKDKNAKN